MTLLVRQKYTMNSRSYTSFVGCSKRHLFSISLDKIDLQDGKCHALIDGYNTCAHGLHICFHRFNVCTHRYHGYYQSPHVLCLIHN
jgi:hypothetical protein